QPCRSRGESKLVHQEHTKICPLDSGWAQTKAAKTSVIPNRHEPSPLYTKIFGSMWARGTLIAVSAAASAFILLSRIMPEHDWLMLMAIICTFETAVGTARTMVSDHITKKPQ